MRHRQGDRSELKRRLQRVLRSRDAHQDWTFELRRAHPCQERGEFFGDQAYLARQGRVKDGPRNDSQVTAEARRVHARQLEVVLVKVAEPVAELVHKNDAPYRVPGQVLDQNRSQGCKGSGSGPRAFGGLHLSEKQQGSDRQLCLHLLGNAADFERSVPAYYVRDLQVLYQGTNLVEGAANLVPGANREDEELSLTRIVAAVQLVSTVKAVAHQHNVVTRLGIRQADEAAGKGRRRDRESHDDRAVGERTRHKAKELLDRLQLPPVHGQQGQGDARREGQRPRGDARYRARTPHRHRRRHEEDDRREPGTDRDLEQPPRARKRQERAAAQQQQHPRRPGEHFHRVKQGDQPRHHTSQHPQAQEVLRTGYHDPHGDNEAKVIISLRRIKNRANYYNQRLYI